MNYQNCDECGGQCCKSFSIPMIYKDIACTTGVPVGIFENILNPDPRRYLELHKGVTIVDGGENFIIDRAIAMREDGDQLLIESECTMLNDRGRCMIYNFRPAVCKNMHSLTLEFYNVPERCKYLPEPVDENNEKTLQDI